MSSSRAAERAKRAYEDRRRRDLAMQDHNIFGEPAWDLLLILFIAGEASKPTSLRALLEALTVPQTTTMRWLKTLESHGLAERLGMSKAGEVARLTQVGRQSMLSYFSEDASATSAVIDLAE